MAHRVIEMLIGRLITDEDFRAEFLGNPQGTLAMLCELGIELSRAEMAAILNTDPSLWARTAEALDPRLQKVSLLNEVRVP